MQQKQKKKHLKTLDLEMSDNIYDQNIFKSIPIDEKMLWILKTNESYTQRLSFLDPGTQGNGILSPLFK